MQNSKCAAPRPRWGTAWNENHHRGTETQRGTAATEEDGEWSMEYGNNPPHDHCLRTLGNLRSRRKFLSIVVKREPVSLCLCGEYSRGNSRLRWGTAWDKNAIGAATARRRSLPTVREKRRRAVAAPVQGDFRRKVETRMRPSDFLHPITPILHQSILPSCLPAPESPCFQRPVLILRSCLPKMSTSGTSSQRIRRGYSRPLVVLFFRFSARAHRRLW